MKSAKSTKIVKRERRAHRTTKAARGRSHPPRLHPIDGSLDRELAERVVAAFDRLDPAAPWTDIAPLVVPVIKRVVQPYPASLAPLTITVPPGIPTGFGIDIGPAFGHVTAAMLEAWAVDTATVLVTALDNLRGLVDREPPRVDPVAVGDVPVVAIQGQGWGSALILVPDVLARIIGSEPRVLITPVRNMLIALPATVDPDVIEDLWDVIAGGRHDELDIDPLCWTGVDVVAVGGRSRRLLD